MLMGFKMGIAWSALLVNLCQHWEMRKCSSMYDFTVDAVDFYQKPHNTYEIPPA